MSLPPAVHCPTKRRAIVKRARRAIVSLCKQITEDSDFSEHFASLYTVPYQFFLKVTGVGWKPVNNDSKDHLHKIVIDSRTRCINNSTIDQRSQVSKKYPNINM